MTQYEYNVGELEDLLRAKDADMAGETASYGSLSPTWVAADSAAFIAWTNQWDALQKAYQSARDAATREISAAKIGYVLDDLMDSSAYRNADATDQYTGILAALNPSWQSNTVAPGSFADLDRRIKAAATSQAVTLPTWQVPQPQNPTSGLNPTSWQGYLAGAASKVGLIDPSQLPPGTPGSKDGPPVVPTWLKIGGGAALGLYIVKSIKDVL